MNTTIKKMKPAKRLLQWALTALLCFASINAHATMPVIDYAALAKLADELSQLKEETQYIQQSLQGMQAGQYQWDDAQGLINNLGTIVSQSNGIAYSASNANTQFKRDYPGYQAPENYSQQYQHNVNTTMDTLDGILQSMGSSADDFQDENTRLQFLQQQSQNAQGETEAIQAATQIASEQVSQIQLLRQTVIAQSNAQAVYYATRVQTQASQQAQLKQIIDAGSTKVPPYGSSGHPLHLPQFEHNF